MLPEVSVGPVTIQMFGLWSVLGLWLGAVLLFRRFRELDYPGVWAWELVLFCIIVGVLGATVNYVIENGEPLSTTPGLILSGGGMIWYGGLFSVIVFLFIWLRFRKMLTWDLLGAAIYCFISLQMLGRIGCQFSGDGDYGIPWSGPWAMGYPNGTLPTPPGVTVHPTPIYEALGLFIVLVLTWKLRWRVSQPTLFAIWLIGAAAVRFPVEFIRRNPDVFLSFTSAQWISIAMICAGIIMLFVYRNKKPPVPLSERSSIPNLRFFSWEKRDQKEFQENIDIKRAAYLEKQKKATSPK